MKLIDGTAIAVCGCSLLFLIIAGRVSTATIELSLTPLAALNASEPPITGTGFATGAVPVPTHIRGVAAYGSWVAGDSSTGSVHTCWYRPVHSFYVLLSGFPKRMPGSLSLELQTAQGLRKNQIQLDENPDYWRLQKISLPNTADVEAFRIAASDTSKAVTGWLGFSQPFTVGRQHTASDLKQLGLVLLCTLTSLSVLIGPGLVLRARWQRAKSSAWLAAPGMVLLGLIGLFAWKGPSALSPVFISRISLAVIVIATGYTLLRSPLHSLLTPPERRTLWILVLLIAMAVSKATYSIGPSGELYRGHISRTLEASSRADSRISYHVVQIVALRQGAYSYVASSLFAPWNFSHRGPFAGLAVSPIVLASRARISAAPPDETWTIFDPQGFAAYRIATIVLSAVSCLFLLALVQVFLDDQWAIFAFFVAVAAPFTVHELFFTWPKILSAAFVLLTVYCIKQSRTLFAGLALGLGYLSHPSALVFFPFVAATVPLLQPLPNLSWPGRLRLWSKHILMLSLGLFVWVAMWKVINRGHFEQTGFIGYFNGAGLLPATRANWLWFRLLTTMKTLVPFFTFLFYRSDPDLIPVDASRQPWVQFLQQYWCTFPFACGIAFFGVVLRLLAAAFRRAVPWMILVFLPALIVFIFYFGAPNSGLMREGLHAWFLGLLLFLVIVWNKYLPHSRALWRFAAVALAVRAIETIWILVPFASWTRGYILQPQFAASDFCCLAVMLAGSIYLGFYGVRECRSLKETSVSRELTYTTALRQH